MSKVTGTAKQARPDMTPIMGQLIEHSAAWDASMASLLESAWSIAMSLDPEMVRQEAVKIQARKHAEGERAKAEKRALRKQ